MPIGHDELGAEKKQRLINVDAICANMISSHGRRSIVFVERANLRKMFLNLPNGFQIFPWQFDEP